MTYLFFTHLIILFIVVSIPFWPINALEYGLYIPTILTLMWVLFGDCPLSRMQSELEGRPFEHVLMQKIFPDITDDQVDHLATFTMAAITLIAAIRLRG